MVQNDPSQLASPMVVATEMFQRKCNVGVSAKTKFQMRLIDQSHSCVNPIFSGKILTYMPKKVQGV